MTTSTTNPAAAAPTTTHAEDHRDDAQRPRLQAVPEPASRVGLVFGAGGPVGHAFHAGVLRAIHERTGWDPRTAHTVVGTSAGAQIAALLRAGVSPDDLAARVTGEPLTDHGASVVQHFLRPEHHQQAASEPIEPMRPRRLRVRRPTAPEYLLHAARRPWEVRPGRLAAALLPRGQVCMQPQIEGLRKVFGMEWPTRNLWVTAVDVHTGRPVAFGHPSGPSTDVGQAVSSSAAVPGVRAPVQIDDRHYVDGGMASPTHLDLLSDVAAELDTVIVCSPLSMYRPMRTLLRREIRRLERRGVEVFAVEPHGEGAEAMGWNCMDLARAGRVAHAVYRSTLDALDAHLADLTDSLLG